MKLKVNNSNNINIVSLFFKLGDIVSTSIMYSPKINEDLAEGKEKKEPLFIKGRIIERYFKNNWYFLNIKNLTGNKQYCVKIKEKSELTIEKNLSKSEEVILSYLEENLENFKRKIILLDIDGIYTLDLYFNEIKLRKYTYYNVRELNKAIISTLIKAVLKELDNSKFHILISFGTDRRFLEIFKKLSSKVESITEISYFDQNLSKILENKEILNKLKLEFLLKDLIILKTISTARPEKNVQNLRALLKNKGEVIIFPKFLNNDNFHILEKFLSDNTDLITKSNFKIINHDFYNKYKQDEYIIGLTYEN